MYEAKIQVFKTPENMMKAYRKLESLKDQKMMVRLQMKE